MNKNANKNSKLVKNKSNKTKVVAAMTPKTGAEIVQAVTPVVVAKTGTRGRPQGTSSSSLVSLKSLVNSLSESAQIPISNRLLKLLNQLGTKIESTPYKMDTSGIAAIAKKYQVTNTSVSVLDLNKPEAVV